MNEISLRILELYRERNIHAGEMLPIQVLQQPFLKDKDFKDIFSQGMTELINEGYLEEKTPKSFKYFLTEKGDKYLSGSPDL